MNHSENSLWLKTQASISEVREFDASRNSPHGWEVTYTYNADGESYVGHCHDYAGSQPRSYSVGDEIQILYKRSNPAKNRILGAKTFLQWVWPYWLTGGIAAIIALIILVLRNR
jgi:hypothetical protein